MSHISGWMCSDDELSVKNVFLGWCKRSRAQIDTFRHRKHISVVENNLAFNTSNVRYLPQTSRSS